MIELKVTVDAPELSAAINHLSEAIESKGTDVPAAPAKNSRSKKAAAKTAPDAPAASAPAPSEPVTPPTPVEQPPVAMPQPAPVQTPVAAPAQQPAPAAPVAAPMMPRPVATATPVMTPPAAPVAQQFIPQPTATPAPAAPAQPQQSSVTLEQIINAAMPLMNSNPAFAMQLQGILAKYGVQAVTQIPKEFLPNVAADLAALGAKF